MNKPSYFFALETKCPVHRHQWVNGSAKGRKPVNVHSHQRSMGRVNGQPQLSWARPKHSESQCQAAVKEKSWVYKKLIEAVVLEIGDLMKFVYLKMLFKNHGKVMVIDGSWCASEIFRHYVGERKITKCLKMSLTGQWNLPKLSMIAIPFIKRDYPHVWRQQERTTTKNQDLKSLEYFTVCQPIISFSNTFV